MKKEDREELGLSYAVGLAMDELLRTHGERDELAEKLRDVARSGVAWADRFRLERDEAIARGVQLWEYATQWMESAQTAVDAIVEAGIVEGVRMERERDEARRLAEHTRDAAYGLTPLGLSPNLRFPWETSDALLNDQLRALRKARSLSLREAAHQLDVTYALVSQVENGVRPMPSRLVEPWAEMLGVSVAEIEQYNGESATLEAERARDIEADAFPREADDE